MLCTKLPSQDLGSGSIHSVCLHKVSTYKNFKLQKNMDDTICTGLQMNLINAIYAKLLRCKLVNYLPQDMFLFSPYISAASQSYSATLLNKEIISLHSKKNT